jgi:hypothetical protein
VAHIRQSHQTQPFSGDPAQAVRTFNVRRLLTLFAALAASVRDSTSLVAWGPVSALPHKPVSGKIRAI